MILDKLILENVGVYGGRHEVRLTPEKNKPIILLGALNGSGKTTFLESVQLALYGPKAGFISGRPGRYQEYLRQAIHRSADKSQGASITLIYRRVQEGVQREYRVRRRWSETKKGITEIVQIEVDGHYDPLISEQWADHIEAYLPSGLAHLFFFDAEQIKDLAQGERAADIIGTAIHSLLGLELVERLEEDLRAYERKQERQGSGERIGQKMTLIETELTRLLIQQKSQQDRLSELKAKRDHLEKEFIAAEDAFRREGGDLYLARSEHDQEFKRLSQLRADAEKQLCELAEQALPLDLIKDLLISVSRQLDREHSSAEAKNFIKTLEKRDTKLLALLSATGLAQGTLRKIQDVFDSDIQERRTHSLEKPFINASEEVLLQIKNLLESDIPAQTALAKKILTEISAIDEPLARQRQLLDKVPEEAAMAHLQTDLQSAKERRTANDKEIEAANIELELTVRQIARTKQDLARIAAEAFESGNSDAEILRTIRHSRRSRETLQKFRHAVISCHVSRIEELILDSFQTLLRKKQLVKSLHIDPTTFQVTLTGVDGVSLPFDRLSAGERQLLATAMIWGLARAAGRPIPTIIDTPLGRLDASHRHHLVTHYFPIASHQVILLSTDTEISGPQYHQLKPAITRTYHMAFDEQLRRTVISSGYLPGIE